MTREYLDRPPAGWFVVEVMPKKAKRGKRDWVALMIDKNPEEAEHSHVEIPFRAASGVHTRPAQQKM